LLIPSSFCLPPVVCSPDRIGFLDPHFQVIELQLQLRQQHAQCAR
jgi:hypothetical protein